MRNNGHNLLNLADHVKSRLGKVSVVGTYLPGLLVNISATSINKKNYHFLGTKINITWNGLEKNFSLFLKLNLANFSVSSENLCCSRLVMSWMNFWSCRIFSYVFITCDPRCDWYIRNEKVPSLIETIVCVA